MTNNIEYLKSLPLVEVSFQDQFCGCEDEIIKTPHLIFHQLLELGIHPKIGGKILLWEKDVDENNQYYYLCNIGEVITLTQTEVKKYLTLDLEDLKSHFFYLDNKPIMIKIDQEAYFYLFLDSEIFAKI